MDFIPFDAIAPCGVDYFSRPEVLRTLKISERYLRKICAILSDPNLGLACFVHAKNARGFRRESVEVIWEFLKLIKKLGSYMAALSIKRHMEKLYERRQGSNLAA